MLTAKWHHERRIAVRQYYFTRPLRILITSLDLSIPTAPDIRAEALELLEWSRLCQQLATFAATPLGNRACQELSPWVPQQQSERLLAQTQEVLDLEETLPSGIPMQGLYDLEDYLQRAERGGDVARAELAGGGQYAGGGASGTAGVG